MKYNSNNEKDIKKVKENPKNYSQFKVCGSYMYKVLNDSQFKVCGSYMYEVQISANNNTLQSVHFSV